MVRICSNLVLRVVEVLCHRLTELRKASALLEQKDSTSAYFLKDNQEGHQVFQFTYSAIYFMTIFGRPTNQNEENERNATELLW